MRGETKHVVGKATEMIHRLSLRADFQADVKDFRKRYSIPEDSFRGEASDTRLEEIKSKNFVEYTIRETLLLEKYGVPRTHTFIAILDYYIVNGDVAAISDIRPNGSFSLEIPNPDEIRKAGRSFLKVVIYDTASQEDMINFIAREAKLIKYFLKIQSIHPVKQIRKSSKPKLDRRMAELNAMSKQELEKMLQLKTPTAYKNSVIYKILLKEGYNPSSSVAVDKAIQRLRKKSETLKPRD
jgi:hypothetical protein